MYSVAAEILLAESITTLRRLRLVMMVGSCFIVVSPLGAGMSAVRVGRRRRRRLEKRLES
jgi:hypothetical protein